MQTKSNNNESYGGIISFIREMKFYIKAASLKTSRSRVESSLCEEKSTHLVIEFKLRESNNWKCKSS
jgi:hypothetical protein